MLSEMERQDRIDYYSEHGWDYATMIEPNGSIQEYMIKDASGGQIRTTTLCGTSNMYAIEDEVFVTAPQWLRVRVGANICTHINQIPELRAKAKANRERRLG